MLLVNASTDYTVHKSSLILVNFIATILICYASAMTEHRNQYSCKDIAACL